MKSLPHFYFLPLLFIFYNADAQSLPDSIVITSYYHLNTGWTRETPDDSVRVDMRFLLVKEGNKYVERHPINLPAKILQPLFSHPPEKYVKYKGHRVDTNSLRHYEETIKPLEEKRVIPLSWVKKLMYSIHHSGDNIVSLQRFGIDTPWIKAHPDEVLQLTKFKKEYHWNEVQRSFIFSELTSIRNYQKELEDYLAEGTNYDMHHSSRIQFIITCHYKGKIVNQLSSKKVVWGSYSPWTDENGRQFFDDDLDRNIVKLLKRDDKIFPPVTGKNLLARMANSIIETKSRSLNQQERYSYDKEIDELKPTFQINSVNRLIGYGAYWGNGNKMQVILHNNLMLPNVNIELILSKTGATLYSRDSVLAAYKNIVERIQSNSFIKHLLVPHPEDQVNILFFDSKPINAYNINAINSSPEKWAQYDDDVKKDEAAPYYNPLYAKRKFEYNHCACNYRFPRDFIEQGIIFILEAHKGGHSRWVLLPDNTILCYYATGVKLVEQPLQTDNPYPCLRFNENGEILPGKHYPL